MKIFEYPYIIITIMAIILVLMGIIGLYFTMKSVRTAKGTPSKGFCSIGKIESDFEKSRGERKSHTLIYISIPLDGMKRLYSESKALRAREQIKRILLEYLCFDADGDVSLYGEENFIAHNNMDADATEQRISSCFEEINKVLVQYDAVGVTHMHCGYICTAATELSFTTAIGRAKQACSIAENKEDLFCRWDSLNGKELERKIKIENNIENEIDNNRFFLEYQPIIDVKTDKIVGAEVLARLNSQSEGVLSPSRFLSAVNNVGLNEKFDYYIFEKNCKWISNDKENRIKYVYTINFSRNTLCDPNLIDNISEIAKKYDITYSCIAVEILEDKNLSADEKEQVMKNIAELKKLGVLILLDDFGTGYTSFTDLTGFDINVVKIDKTITQNSTSNQGFLILKNIIQTAHDLGFKALCEGIETEEHKKAAEEAGCDFLQGYYFYRPMPVAQLEALFDK